MSYTVSDVCFFDAETTGIPAKGLKWESDFSQFPDIVQLSWKFGDIEKDYIIKPQGWDIPQEAAEIHGITTEIALEKGVPFSIVIDEFLTDAEKAPLISAHNIYFDTSMIKANVLHYCGKQYYDEMCDRALDKSKRIDTMMKTIKFVGALHTNGRLGKFPTLVELHEKLFPGETFEAHNALADVKALSRCLPKLVELGIIELKVKEYPDEQSKQEKISFTKREIKKPEEKIEFTDDDFVSPADLKPESKEHDLLSDNDF